MNSEYADFITPTITKAQTKFMYKKMREFAKQSLKNPSNDFIQTIKEMFKEAGLDADENEIRVILQDYADCLNQISQTDLNNTRHNRMTNHQTMEN